MLPWIAPGGGGGALHCHLTLGAKELGGLDMVHTGALPPWLPCGTWHLSTVGEVLPPSDSRFGEPSSRPASIAARASSPPPPSPSGCEGEGEAGWLDPQCVIAVATRVRSSGTAPPGGLRSGSLRLSIHSMGFSILLPLHVRGTRPTLHRRFHCDPRSSFPTRTRCRIRDRRRVHDPSRNRNRLRGPCRLRSRRRHPRRAPTRSRGQSLANAYDHRDRSIPVHGVCRGDTHLNHTKETREGAGCRRVARMAMASEQRGCVYSCPRSWGECTLCWRLTHSPSGLSRASR
jgi:hypothetical protein